MTDAELQQRYALLHGSDTEAARAELARVQASGKPVVVVSACLLGVRCRWDGGDKRNDEAVAREARDGEILPLCPEVLARFGVPRPPITLEGGVAKDDRGRDVTQQLESGARLADRFAGDAARALLKSKSPSCGDEGRFTIRLKKRGMPVAHE